MKKNVNSFLITKLSQNGKTKLSRKKKKQEIIGGPFAINNPMVSASMLENLRTAIKAQFTWGALSSQIADFPLEFWLYKKDMK